MRRGPSPQPSPRGIDEVGLRPPSRFSGDRRAPVPRADVLADIAAKDLAAYRLTQLMGDNTFFLDGQVGDAAGGIHLARGDQSVRRTRIDTAGATATAVLRFVKGGVCLYWERGHDDAEQQPRSQTLVDDTSILSDPAN